MGFDWDQWDDVCYCGKPISSNFIILYCGWLLALGLPHYIMLAMMIYDTGPLRTWFAEHLVLNVCF
jgi:hypothetical protein